MFVIVGVFRFDQEEIADEAVVDELLGQGESGCKPADLAYHKRRLRFVRRPDYRFDIIHRQGQRFLAQHVFARAQRGDAVFTMERIRRGHGNDIQIFAEQVFIPHRCPRHAVLLGHLFHARFVCITHDRDFGVWILLIGRHMRRAHPQPDYACLEHTIGPLPSGIWS